MPTLSWRLTLRIIALLSWLVGLIWFIAEPGFEPLLAFLGGVTALIISFAASDAPHLEFFDLNENRITARVKVDGRY